MAGMPLEFVVALGAVFVSVALLAGLAAFAVVSRQSPTQRRLDALLPARAAATVVLPGSLTSGRDPVLARWSKMIPKSAKDMSGLERRLAAAGFKSPLAAVAFGGAEFVLPVLAVLAVIPFFGLTNLSGWVVAAFAGALGYLAPGLYLDLKMSARRKQIRNGLPDVLDLLIVCLEAGSSLDQAIIKASEELFIAYPALAEELRTLTTETRAGKPRLEAFRNLAQRTKVEDVRALVAMLAQTDRFGTSVAQTLRTMADDMRMKRRQAAEEMAAKVGVKLVFPLVFFLFPALYVVMLGPAVMQFLHNFPK
jgi:tight adherence protein C